MNGSSLFKTWQAETGDDTELSLYAVKPRSGSKMI